MGRATDEELHPHTQVPDAVERVVDVREHVRATLDGCENDGRPPPTNEDACCEVLVGA